MADRLSEESLVSVLDTGTNIDWAQDEPTGILAGYDLNAICENPAAAEIIPSIPAQSIYISLLRQGPADCLAVLPLLSADQVVRIFDYDTWRHDVPDLKRATRWLSLFAELGREELYKRYHDLDEEYQIALLYGKVVTYTDEDLDDLDDEVKDELHAMPCNTVFYRLLTNDQVEYECIQALIGAALEQNIGYAYMLLAYAENAIPNESSHQLTQFRLARMEEDGFVSYAESLEIFRAVDLETYLTKYRIARDARNSREQNLIPWDSTQKRNPFLNTLLQLTGVEGWGLDERFQVHQTLLYLVNSLCAVSKVEPDDIAAMNRLMQQAQALVSLGLEFLSGGDTDLGLSILKQEPAKDLFRVGLGLIDFVRNKMLTKLAEAGLPHADRLQKLLKQRKWGRILQTLDASVRDLIGFEQTEILKGLFNRFPMMPRISKQDDKKSGHLVRFDVIDSLASFGRFVAALDGVAGLLHLARHQAAVSLTVPLEKSLATCAVLAALGEPCAVRALTADEISQFSMLTDGDFNDFKFDFWTQVHDMLAPIFFEWSVSNGYTNPKDSLEHVIALFKDIVLGLELARTDEDNLKALVLTD